MSGSAAGGNKIIKPGYHIRPKYDLHGLRRRRTSDHSGHIAGELPLTSMIDMFSILVIYLLMNFSATGEVFFNGKGLQLPQALSTNPLANGPLLSIIGENFVLESPPDYGSFPPTEDMSPGLERIIGSLKNLKVAGEQKNLGFGNRINIQASEDAPVGLVKRAMAAAVSAGWGNINFVVEKPK